MANNYPALKPSLNIDNVNGIYVDSRITFVRAGGRTFFDDEMVKAEENLLIHSADLTQTAYFKSGLTASSATQITASATTAARFVAYQTTVAGNLPASGSVTGTLRVSAGTHTFIQIFIANGALDIANIDLSDGSIGTNTLGATVTAIGGGVYDIKATFTTNGVNRVLALAMVTSTTAVRQESWTALGTETVNILFQQYEQRSFATAYTATTTQPITRYQRLLKTAAANEWPREFDPVTGECLGRSVWEARTNLLLRSEEFDNASWAKSAKGDGVLPVVTANQTIAPDGTLTADKVDFVRGTASAGNASLISSNANTVTAIPYFGTVYMKAATPADVGKQLNFRHVSAGAFLIVTLTAEWQRVGRVETGLAGSRFMQMGVSDILPETSVSVFLWGAQLEAGAFATPYIPTVASQVTRVADSAVMTGVNFSSWFNPEQGTLFQDSSSPAQIWVNADDGTPNNRIFVNSRFSGSTSNFGLITTAGATNADFTGQAHQANNKVAMSYSFNDCKGSLNGGTVLTDTVAVMPIVNTLRIGAVAGTIGNGYIKRLTYYNQALTAANLQAITR
jgi:hypothetical protein